MGKPAYIGDVKAGCALKLIQNLMGMSINAVCSKASSSPSSPTSPGTVHRTDLQFRAFSFQFKNTASGTFDEDSSIRCSP
ncbi:MAG: hypothetical protein ACLSAH_03965 [Bilophila wadsworthia]